MEKVKLNLKILAFILIMLITSVMTLIAMIFLSSFVTSLSVSSTENQVKSAVRTINLAFTSFDSERTIKAHNDLSNNSDYSSMCSFLAQSKKINSLDKLYTITKILGDYYYVLDADYSENSIANVDYFQHASLVDFKQLPNNVQQTVKNIFDKKESIAVTSSANSKTKNTCITVFAPIESKSSENIVVLLVGQADVTYDTNVQNSLAAYTSIAVIASVMILLSVAAIVLYILAYKNKSLKLRLKKLQASKNEKNDDQNNDDDRGDYD